MINSRFNQRSAFNSLFSIEFPKIDRKKISSIVKNSIIILMLLISMTAPLMESMAKADTTNTQNSNTSNTSELKDNNGKVIDPTSPASSQPKYTITTSIKQSDSNANGNNPNAMFGTSAIQTPSGMPGNNSIGVNETADLSYTKSDLKANNTFDTGAGPVTSYLYNTTSYTYSKPTGYTNISNTFDISNITSTTGVKNIENNGGSAPSDGTITTSTKTSIRSVGSSFVITDQQVNISQINLFIGTLGSPAMNFSITGALASAPDLTNIYYTYDISSQVGGKYGWTPITFPQNITLQKGTYYFWFNDTDPGNNPYITFYDVADGAVPANNASRVVVTGDAFSGTYITYNYDIALQYRYLVLNDTDKSLHHVYSTPDQVYMRNNGRNVTGLTNNYFNFANTTMQFTSNVSVTFSVTQDASVFLTTPSSTSISYGVSNSTFANWNVSFTDTSFPSNSFTMTNRIFSLSGLSANWNATTVLNNSFIFDSIPFTSKVTYTNGSTSLSFNSSTDSNFYTWILEFQSPNFVTSVNLQTIEAGVINYPFDVNSTDTLSVSANLFSSVSDTNGTLVFYDYNGNSKYSEKDVSSSSGTLTFSNFNLSTYIDPNSPNGTYVIAVEFFDTTTQTELGYYELQINVVGSTTLLTTAIPDTIKGTNITLSLAYENLLNSTNVNNATVSYATSWSTVGSFSNVNNGNYSTSINTSTATVGYESILITASLANYVTQTVNLSVTIVTDTSLTITSNATTYNYFDVINISVSYKDLFNSENINGSTITYNGMAETGFITATNTSYFLYNTSLLSPSLTNYTITVSANKTFYYPRTGNKTVDLSPAPTDILHYTSDPTNNTGIDQHYFSFNVMDQYTYNIAMHDSKHNLVVYDATLLTNATSDLSVSGIGVNQDLANGTWVITVNPLKAGTYHVEFNFTKPGYDPVKYAITFDVLQTPTTLLVGGQAQTSSGSYYDVGWSDGQTYNFTYYYGSKDTVTLNFTLYDNYYMQNMTESGISGNLTSVSGYYTLVYNNNTGTWDISIDPSATSSFTLVYTIYSSQVNSYANQTFTIHINIKNITTTVAGTALINGSTYTVVNGGQLNTTYQEGGLDDVNLTLYFEDTYWNENVTFATLIKNGGSGVYISSTNTSIQWNVAINPNQTSLWMVNLTFIKNNYDSYTLILYIRVYKADINLVNPSSVLYTNSTSTTVSYDSGTLDTVTYYFILKNKGYSSNITSITTLTISGAGSSSLSLGSSFFNYTFNPDATGTYTLTITINYANYNSYQVIIHIYVLGTPTTVYDNTSSSYSNATAVFGSTYDLGSQDTVSLYFAFIDTNQSIRVSNGTMTVNTLGNNNTNYFLYVDHPNTYIYSNWTITIDPNKIGTYYFILTFNKTGYNSFFLNVTINVLANTFNIVYTNNTVWNNNAIYTNSYNQGTKDNTTAYLTIKDALYGNNLTVAYPIASSNGSYTISLQDQTNGIWKVSINPLVDGMYNISIIIYQYGYINKTIYITINVLTTATNPIYTGPVVWTNGTIFNQTYSETTFDEITVYITSNDTLYNEYVNASFTNLNSGSTVLNVTPIYFSNNNTWKLIINPISVGYDNFNFTLTQPGYDPIFINLIFNITRPILLVEYSAPGSKSINFGNDYSFYVNVTSNFDGSYVSGVSELTNTSYLTVIDYGNGTYKLTYSLARAYLPGASEYVNITFSKTNFDANFTYWSFTVIDPISALPTTASSSQTVYNAEWDNNMTVVITWYDTNTGYRLNTTSVTTDSNSTVKIYLVSVDNGTYVFRVYSTTVVSNFNVVFTFTNSTLSSYFANGTITLTFNGLKRTTAVLQGIISTNYNSGNNTVSNYYTRTSEINVTWYDPVLSSYVVMSSSSFSNNVWVTYSYTSNGILVFTITADKVGLFNITLTLKSALYTDLVFWVFVSSRIIPTNPIVKSNTNTFNISQGLYADLTNTSKLGFVLELDSNWLITDNSTQVSTYNTAVYRNSILLSEADGIYVTTGYNSQYSSKILMTFLPQFGYKKGWYNFSIDLTKYGFINQSVNFDLYIRGFNLVVTPTIPPRLTRGDPYTITIVVTYDNATAANLSNQQFFKIAGMNQVPTDPVNNISVNFFASLTVKDANGNNQDTEINKTKTTGSDGSVFFTIDADVTKNLVKINSISFGLAGSDYNDFEVQNLNSAVISKIEIADVTPLDPLFIIGPVVAVIILFLFGILFVRRRSKKNAKIKAILRANLDKLELVNSVYSIMLTTSTGLPILTRINAVYSKSKAVEELISGLSVGIDTFLSSFQSDFMSKIGTTDQTKADPNNPQHVFMSAIKRNEFHVLIIGSPAYRGFVFLRDAPTRFAEQTFFSIIEQIQAKVLIDVVFDEDEVKREVEQQIKLFFPFTLLDKFVLNAEKLAEAEDNGLLSSSSSEVLKRLFAVTTGATSIAENPQKQVAAFNKVLKKNAMFSKASDKMDQIKSGVLFYNTCYHILSEQLKIAPATITEALWEANLKNLGIFESID